MRKITPFFLLLLFGCAAHKTAFVPVHPSDGKGSVLYVYRSSEVSNLMIAPAVNIKAADGNQTKLGKLSRGEYKLLYLPAGKYEVQLEAIDYYAPGSSLQIELKPGAVDYLRLDSALKFETGVRYKSYERKLALQEVEETIALTEMASCVDLDSKSKKNTGLIQDAVEDVSGDTINNDEDAHFSTDKTADPFSRRQ